MKILIDNGHGIDTPGKRSPDGRFREYKYNREIAKAVVEHLQLRGYDAELLVPEEEDISLKERVRRANKITCQIGYPVQETIIVSIHVNAAGNGKRWYNATGWCCYTYYGHSLSDELATCLYKVARHHLPGHKLRTVAQPCRGFLYYGVSISDNSPSIYFGECILLRIFIRLYIKIVNFV